MTFNIVIAGARSVRQGTGPFIAAALQKAGAHISGIVGTSVESVQLAEHELALRHGITTRGYTDLRAAIAAETPDVVALCTPWHVHAEQLAIVAEAGCHCLVEKPLAWPLSNAELNLLIEGFESRGLLLQMVSQWPHTLPAFHALHGPFTEPAERFAMRLSPISIGETMIPDAAPHLISMLQALVGPGDCEDIVVTPGRSSERSALDTLAICFTYQSARGAIEAQLLLQTCAQRPRPAWYQINDMKVERDVVLPEYQQYLVANGRRVALNDPMEVMAADFVAMLRGGIRGQGPLLQGRNKQGRNNQGRNDNRAQDTFMRLRSGHNNLLQLAAACAQTLVV